jgi:hypothetical protein
MQTHNPDLTLQYPNAKETAWFKEELVHFSRDYAMAFLSRAASFLLGPVDGITITAAAHNQRVPWDPRESTLGEGM